jgi:hypothetical protein
MVRSQAPNRTYAYLWHAAVQNNPYLTLRDRTAKTVTLDRNIFATRPPASRLIDLQQLQLDEPDRVGGPACVQPIMIL